LVIKRGTGPSAFSVKSRKASTSKGDVHKMRGTGKMKVSGDGPHDSLKAELYQYSGIGGGERNSKTTLGIGEVGGKLKAENDGKSLFLIYIDGF